MFELRDLPTVNATLNGISASLLVLGFFLIRSGRRKAHRNIMVAAFSCSVLFLISYLTYHYSVGSVRFQGTGWIRKVYFSILLTHTVLAAAVPFLAVATLRLAIQQKYAKHRALARWTLPIWLYVSVTGVVVYWMLYRL